MLGIAALVAPTYLDDAMPAITLAFLGALACYEFVYQRGR